VLYQTLEQAKSRGLIEKYKTGVRSMATDILVNAANSNSIKDVYRMIDWQPDERPETSELKVHSIKILMKRKDWIHF